VSQAQRTRAISSSSSSSGSGTPLTGANTEPIGYRVPVNRLVAPTVPQPHFTLQYLPNTTASTVSTNSLRSVRHTTPIDLSPLPTVAQSFQFPGQQQPIIFDTRRVSEYARQTDVTFVYDNWRFLSGPEIRIHNSGWAARHNAMNDIGHDIPARILDPTPMILPTEEGLVGYLDADPFYGHAIRGERYFFSRPGHLYTIQNSRVPSIRTRQHVIVIQMCQSYRARLATSANTHVLDTGVNSSVDIPDLSKAIWGESLHRWAIYHILTTVSLCDQVQFMQMLEGVRRELGAPRNAIIVLIGGCEPIQRVFGNERIWRQTLEAPRWAGIILRAIDMVREVFTCPYTLYAGFNVTIPPTRAGDIMRETMDWFKLRIDALGSARQAYVTDLFSRSYHFNHDGARAMAFYEAAPLLMANLVRALIICRFWGNPVD
jgi:hypothetical protein